MKGRMREYENGRMNRTREEEMTGDIRREIN
jgi:hypothetical protein